MHGGVTSERGRGRGDYTRDVCLGGCRIAGGKRYKYNRSEFRQSGCDFRRLCIAYGRSRVQQCDIKLFRIKILKLFTLFGTKGVYLLFSF